MKPFFVSLLLAALILAAGVVGGCAGTMSSQPMTNLPAGAVTRPAQLDASTHQTSAGGNFVVAYRDETGSPAINQLETWVIHVQTVDGKPVPDAVVAVTGGMPEHNHGLPTTPQVTNAGGGDYRVEGLKFHMPGWWTVTVQVTAGGLTDSATFNLLLP